MAARNTITAVISGLYALKPDEVVGRLSRIDIMPNGMKTALLLGALSAVLLFLGESLGGSQGLVVGFFFAVVTNFVSYWFSDKIVLAMYGAKAVGPENRLYRVVERLAQRASL